MDLFQVGTDPWGQEILIRISWVLLTMAFWAGIAFILFHAVYVVVWKPKVEVAAAATAEVEGIPDKIVRHTGAARAFHWVMATSMLVLLATGFLPILGLEFDWLNLHWIFGLILILCILYHIVHASFFLDFWSIWILPSDLGEAVQRTKRQLGQSADVGKHGKYPLDHKLYHLAVMLAGTVVIGTGIVMMARIDTPLWPRNAYLVADPTWGLIYVLHGLGAVLFVTLTLTHVYFAARPDKLWMTKSMVFGYVDRNTYLEHHDPERWVVSQESTKG
jgi:formate dehydrogenase subunit gamma